MKRLLAFLLCLILIFSCAACQKPSPAGGSSDVSSADIVSSEEATSSDTTSSAISDFKETLDKSNLEVTTSENEDGTITVELNPTKPDKEENEDSSKPDVVIPTIDTLPKPAPLPDEEEEEEPVSSQESSAEGSTENDSSDNTTTDSSEADTSSETSSSENVSSETVSEPEEKKDYTYTTGQKHSALPYSERYIYSTLNETEKGWYEKIDAAVKNLETKVFLNADLVSNQDYYIYFMYMFDNPEYFYLCNTVGIYSLSGNRHGLILSYSDGVTSSGTNFSDATFPEGLKDSILAKKAAFDSKVESIISTIPADAPDVVKEKLIYDRIIIDAHYNLNAKWNGLCEDNWNAYGVIMNKMGVCESYSEAFQLLCLKVGICCTGVAGTAGGNHKWNAVKLENEWYACDVTFDDPIGNAEGAAPFHYYFNITTAQMISAQHFVDNIYPSPECKGTKYNFQKYFGK